MQARVFTPTPSCNPSLLAFQATEGFCVPCARQQWDGGVVYKSHVLLSAQDGWVFRYL